jgi:hypothetical protein
MTARRPTVAEQVARNKAIEQVAADAVVAAERDLDSIAHHNLKQHGARGRLRHLRHNLRAVLADLDTAAERVAAMEAS